MTQNLSENPYVGPRTFEIEERDFFFGRTREAMDLLSLVISERLVLFYAQSGAGKSSLINTKLIPDLIAEGEYKILPVGRLIGDTRKGPEVRNIYIHNLISSLTKRGIDEAVLARLSLSDFLTDLDFDAEDGYFYNENTSTSFSPGDDDTFWKYVLIIDQFEELFTYYQEEWEKREDFFKQLAQAMQDFPNLWIVLVMREDYIAYLDPYAYLLPGRLRVRYYMQRLSQEAAIEAVEGPAGVRQRSYAEGVAQKLVEDLSSIKVRTAQNTWETQDGQFVEPVQLQVVCSRLWEKLPEDKKLITAEDLELHIRDINSALGDYYEERVQSVAEMPRTKEKGVIERTIRNWFDRELITPGGIRSMVLREPNGKSGSLDDEIVQKFQGDLVRAQNRGDATWYELTHDRLVEPILKSNDEWFEKNSSLLQKQTELWVIQGRPEGMLLRGKELEQAEAESESKTITRDETDFLEACRKAHERERQERRGNLLVRVLAVAVTVAMIAALGLAISASNAANAADAARKTAEAAVFTATFSLGEANEAKAREESARGIFQAEALAGKAQIALGQSDTVRLGQLLAVEAYKINNRVRPGEILPSVYQALYASAGTGRGVELRFSNEFSAAAFNAGAGRRWLAVDSILLDLEDLDQFTPLDIEADEVLQSSFLSPEQLVLLTSTTFFSPEYYVYVVEPMDQTVEQIYLTLPPDADISEVNLSDNGRWATITYAISNEAGGALLWDMMDLSGDPAIRLQAGEPEAISTVVSEAGDSAAMVDTESLYLYKLDAPRESDLLEPEFTLALDRGFEFERGNFLGRSGRGLQFSADGQRLAVLTRSNIRVYDTSTGEIVAGISDQDQVVTGFGFSPDRRYLIYILQGPGGTTRVLRRLLAEETDSAIDLFYRSTSAPITAMDISSNGQLVVGDAAGYVRAWDVDQVGTEPQSVVSAHDGRITELVVGPDDQVIISAGARDGTRIWELNLGATDAVFVHQISNLVSSVVRSDDGETLILGGLDPDYESSGIQLYGNLRTPEQLTDIRFASEGGSELGPVAFSTAWIAAARTNERLQGATYFLDVWKRTTAGETSGPLSFALTSAASNLVFYPDGRYLAIASSAGDLWLVDTADLDPLIGTLRPASPGDSNPTARQLIYKTTLPGGLTNVQSMSFTRDGRFLIAANASSVYVWDMQQEGVNTDPPLSLPAMHPIRISPDQRWLIAAGSGNLVHRFDLQNIKAAALVFGTDNGTLSQFAFSREGDTLAVATRNRKILVFDMREGSDLSVPSYTLSGPTSEITWMEFSPPEAPGGEWLVAGSGSGVYLWNMKRLDDKPILLSGINASIVYAGFTVDGQWILAAGEDQTLRHWSMDLEKISRAACKFAARNLKWAEWERYFPDVEYNPENADTCGPEFAYELETIIPVSAGPSPTPGPTSAPAALHSTSTPPAESCETYRVVAGDNLALIASRFNISMSTLIADNGISDPNLIREGQTLEICSG